MIPAFDWMKLEKQTIFLDLTAVLLAYNKK
jgi:hypothetical protein